MNRRMFVWFLCALCLLSGCTAEKLEIDDAESAEKTVLRIHMFDKDMKSRLESAAYLYAKQHPQVELSFTASADEDANLSDLKAMRRAGDLPTLFCVRGKADIEDLGHPLENLRRHPLADAALPHLLDAVTVGQAVYGLPVCQEASGVVANRKMLYAAGFYPKQITGLRALRRAAKALDAAVRSGALKADYPRLAAVFAPPEADTGAQLRTLLHTADSSGAQTVDRQTALRADRFTEVRETLLLERTYSRAAMDQPATSAAQALANGEIAMAVASNRIINTVKELDADLADELIFLPVFSGRVSLSVPAYWAIPKDAAQAQKDAALDFLSWLNRAEDGKQQSVSTLYFIPAYAGFENLPSTEALNRSAQSYIEDGKTCSRIASAFPTEMDDDYFSDKLLDYLKGNRSWDALVREIQQDYARLVS